MADFWEEQLDDAKSVARAYSGAITALTVGGAQSYTLDTGQTRQTVTKFDIASLERAYDSALNRVATLEARLYGTGSVTGRPDF